jgi:uncharacterized membrane protein YjjP (DUF1212 family)
MSDSNRNKLRDALVLPVAVAVILGWLAALGQAVLTQQYTALTVTTPLMLLLAGFAFGTSIVRSASKDGPHE